MNNSTTPTETPSPIESVIYNKFEEGSDILTEKSKKDLGVKISWYFSWYSSDNNIVSKGQTIKACDIQTAIVDWSKNNSGTIIYIQNKSL